MTVQEQIAAIKATLALMDTTIAQTESALAAAAAADKPSLRAALSELRGERTRLQMQLANLEAAAVVVAPLGAAPRMAAPRAAAATRMLSAAQSKAATQEQARKTLKLALDLGRMGRTLRSIGDDTTLPRRRPRPSLAGDDTTLPRRKKPR